MAEMLSKFLRFIGVEEEDDDQEEFVETQQNPRSPREPERQAYYGQQNPQYQHQQYQQSQPNRQYAQQNPQQGYGQPQNAQPGRQTYQPEMNAAKNKGGKVVQHPSYDGTNNVKHQTTIYQISEHTEAKAVIDDLLNAKSVLLNLENLDAVESQRVIDTLSGAAYAISAKLRKVAHQTYLIAPSNVEIGGNFSEDGKRSSVGSNTMSGSMSSSMFRGRTE